MDKRVAVWHDLAEKIVEKVMAEYDMHGREDLLNMVEQTIKKFANKRVARIYFISGDEE